MTGKDGAERWACWRLGVLGVVFEASRTPLRATGSITPEWLMSKRLLRWLSVLVALATGCGSSTTGPTSATTEAVAAEPIELWVPVAPSPVVVGGERHLVWEVFVTNATEQPVSLERVDVTDAAGAVVVLLDETALAESFRVLRSEVEGTTIGPGQTGVVYFWHTLVGGDAAPAPDALRHRLVLRDSVGEAVEHALTVGVGDETPRVVAPPVLGQGWMAINSPSNESRHRRSVQVLDEGLFTAQRYAVDLVYVGEGNPVTGDPSLNESYLAYGQELLAVADGTVVAVHDGVPENVPNSGTYAVEIDYSTLAGNYVVLDIGADRYAVYAHLQPGSLRVASGDTVGVGQVLGLLGNSGNSTQPHLHLHICDAPEVLACHGRPWAIAAFVQVPITETAPGEFQSGAPRHVTAELPVQMGYLVLAPPDELAVPEGW